MPPTLSVVTICLNDRAGLAATLDSVLSQTFTDHELVVVDGGSTDGSVDEVRAREARIARWVSEKDRGIYDAQNKGIGLARGEYVMLLNAGDVLASTDALARLLEPRPTEDIVYADAWLSQFGARRLRELPDELTLSFLMRSSLPSQASIVRRALYEKLGAHDLQFRIAADYDFWIRALVVNGATYRHVPYPVSVQDRHGLSARPSEAQRIQDERARVHQKNLSPMVLGLWKEHVALQERTFARRMKALFRPVARPMRRLVRRLRGRPEDWDLRKG